MFTPYAAQFFRLELPTRRSTALAAAPGEAGRETCTKMDFLIALVLLDCAARTHPISGRTGKPLQIPQRNFSLLGWNQTLLTFSSPSLSKKRRFCSMACAEKNCTGKTKTTKQRNKVRSQIISSEFPESFCSIPTPNTFPWGQVRDWHQPGCSSPCVATARAGL